MAANCTTVREHYQEFGNSAKQTYYLTRKIKDQYFVLNWSKNMPTVLKCKMQYFLPLKYVRDNLNLGQKNM
jgi:hypothetical protein